MKGHVYAVSVSTLCPYMCTVLQYSAWAITEVLKVWKDEPQFVLASLLIKATVVEILHLSFVRWLL